MVAQEQWVVCVSVRFPRPRSMQRVGSKGIHECSHPTMFDDDGADCSSDDGDRAALTHASTRAHSNRSMPRARHIDSDGYDTQHNLLLALP